MVKVAIERSPRACAGHVSLSFFSFFLFFFLLRRSFSLDFVLLSVGGRAAPRPACKLMVFSFLSLSLSLSLYLSLLLFVPIVRIENPRWSAVCPWA